MKREPKMVMGKLDPEALKRPNVAWYQSEEFCEKLTEGMAEAKEAALRRQAGKEAARDTPSGKSAVGA